MKIFGYIRCAVMIVVLIVIVDIVNSAVPQDRLDPQNLDPYVVDVKAKRPFCNAFTGCGRKRSSSGVAQNSNPMSTGEGMMKVVRLPLPLYRALLRAAASQEMNNQIIDHQDQSVGGDYNSRQLQDIPLQEFDISAQKMMQPRDQYES